MDRVAITPPQLPYSLRRHLPLSIPTASFLSGGIPLSLAPTCASNLEVKVGVFVCRRWICSLLSLPDGASSSLLSAPACSCLKFSLLDTPWVVLPPIERVFLYDLGEDGGGRPAEAHAGGHAGALLAPGGSARVRGASWKAQLLLPARARRPVLGDGGSGRHSNFCRRKRGACRWRRKRADFLHPDDPANCRSSSLLDLHTRHMIEVLIRYIYDVLRHVAPLLGNIWVMLIVKIPIQLSLLYVMVPILSYLCPMLSSRK